MRFLPSRLTITNVLALVALGAIGAVTGWLLPNDRLVEVARGSNNAKADFKTLFRAGHFMINNEHSAHQMSAHEDCCIARRSKPLHANSLKPIEV